MNPEQHAEHMSKVKAGLEAIMASQDINEVHQIAQGLLAEEQGEQAAEGQGAEKSAGDNLREKLGAMGG